MAAPSVRRRLIIDDKVPARKSSVSKTSHGATKAPKNRLASTSEHTVIRKEIGRPEYDLMAATVPSMTAAGLELKDTKVYIPHVQPGAEQASHHLEPFSWADSHRIPGTFYSNISHDSICDDDVIFPSKSSTAPEAREVSTIDHEPAPLNSSLQVPAVNGKPESLTSGHSQSAVSIHALLKPSASAQALDRGLPLPPVLTPSPLESPDHENKDMLPSSLEINPQSEHRLGGSLEQSPGTPHFTGPTTIVSPVPEPSSDSRKEAQDTPIKVSMSDVRSNAAQVGDESSSRSHASQLDAAATSAAYWGSQHDKNGSMRIAVQNAVRKALHNAAVHPQRSNREVSRAYRRLIAQSLTEAGQKPDDQLEKLSIWDSTNSSISKSSPAAPVQDFETIPLGSEENVKMSKQIKDGGTLEATKKPSETDRYGKPFADGIRDSVPRSRGVSNTRSTAKEKGKGKRLRSLSEPSAADGIGRDSLILYDSRRQKAPPKKDTDSWLRDLITMGEKSRPEKQTRFTTSPPRSYLDRNTSRHRANPGNEVKTEEYHESQTHHRQTANLAGEYLDPVTAPKRSSSRHATAQLARKAQRGDRMSHGDEIQWMSATNAGVAQDHLRSNGHRRSSSHTGVDGRRLSNGHLKARSEPQNEVMTKTIDDLETILTEALFIARQTVEAETHGRQGMVDDTAVNLEEVGGKVWNPMQADLCCEDANRDMEIQKHENEHERELALKNFQNALPSKREIKRFIEAFQPAHVDPRYRSKKAHRKFDIGRYPDDDYYAFGDLREAETEIDFTTPRGVINTTELEGNGTHKRHELRDPGAQVKHYPTHRHDGKSRRLHHKLSLRGKSHATIEHLHHFSLSRSYKHASIARDWSKMRKRFVATVACISTALIGILIGIYAGEVPSIQYYIVDFHHFAVLGNVFMFIGLALSTFTCWPLPLLHGRKPYILGAMTIAMPLLFPQAIMVSRVRNPYTHVFRVGLILPRAVMGFILGFANVNTIATLMDLFGASLQSGNPHQEIVDQYDVRRHGGGMGIWLGIWTWCYIGSIGIGFWIGAWIINELTPDWGFYVSIVIIAAVLLLNIVCPETRRSAYRRSVAEVRGHGEVSRRLAKGEVMMHRLQTGPKWWGEEFHQGVMLSKDMLLQPGFSLMALYVAWIYGQVVLVIVLLGSLMSKYYRFKSPIVGVTTLSIPLGALLAIPFQKASFFSRARHHPQRTDSMTFEHKVTWTSHFLRRAIFTIVLPFAGLAYTLSSGGPPTPFILPILFAGLIGFLSNLAIAECNGIIMEAFDTSDLQPGMTGRPRGKSGEKTRHKRTNYSSFPRVSSAFAITQALGFLIAAVATGVGGVAQRHLGQQASTGVMAVILLILTLGVLGALIRWKDVQIIPSTRTLDMEDWDRRRKESVLAAKGKSVKSPDSTELVDMDDNGHRLGVRPGVDDNEPWRPVIIGNPSGKTRRMSILEMGALSRWSEIRRRNRLVDAGKIDDRSQVLSIVGDVRDKFRKRRASRRGYHSDRSWTGSGSEAHSERTV